MMGLLPNVADGVHVSIPQAGHLISSYALGVVVGAPLLARRGGADAPQAPGAGADGAVHAGQPLLLFCPGLFLAAGDPVHCRPAARRLLWRRGRHCRLAGGTEQARTRHFDGDAGPVHRQRRRRSAGHPDRPAVGLAADVRPGGPDRPGHPGQHRALRPGTEGARRRQHPHRTRRAQTPAGLADPADRHRGLRRVLRRLYLCGPDHDRGRRLPGGLPAGDRGTVRPGHGEPEAWWAAGSRTGP